VLRGIYKAPAILLPDATRARTWPKRPNEAFGGKSALEVMRLGRATTSTRCAVSWTPGAVAEQLVRSRDLYCVPKEDWVTGPNASAVMTAFTHIGGPSRFTDGGYGVCFAALDGDTGVAETVFHAERFLRESAAPSIVFERRCYVGKITAALDDLRGPRFAQLRDPDIASCPRGQAFSERAAPPSPGDCITRAPVSLAASASPPSAHEQFHSRFKTSTSAVTATGNASTVC